ncbi:hypothetical protein IE077_003805 [Cardiosporidium cionae]|uniref:Uncharacterized protein n=1 Tax=Cardiosporidium cionae TaxID=476202 RepID=A0ABQ7JEJ6_9APIC|nr:hypothetical protein IE077_003805 [Cardiosporidium cionae]|eukprot:KAF8822421.1 hypothetical protein IE077_003805 [Cardiosporidium cionae]
MFEFVGTRGSMLHEENTWQFLPQKRSIQRVWQQRAKDIQGCKQLLIVWRAVAFAVGAAFSYGFAAPDEGNVYDIFPVYKQNKYAFITYYNVSDDDAALFEENIKNLHRFYQQQRGYLFTKLLKAKYFSQSEYQYIAINTWTNPESFDLAQNRPVAMRLGDGLPGRQTKALFNKIVVDDSEYNPLE